MIHERNFAPDLSKPSLTGLSYLLRHRELWPEGFNFYFMRCEDCAIGLAHRVWRGVPLPMDDTSYDIIDSLYQELGVLAYQGYCLFVATPNCRGSNYPYTADDVAREIDRFLARRSEVAASAVARELEYA